MKLLFDFLPIFLFFIAYKISGIFAATIVAIITTLIQVLITYTQKRSVELMHILTLALIVILGLATLFLHNEMFIKWKPTAINWVFAIMFVLSQFSKNKKTILERMMSQQITLPKHIWKNLNLSWAIFFTLLGGMNLYVVYNFDTNAWVNFKLFGVLGLTILFVILQAIYMTQYMNQHVKLDEES
jgi:intracellular septation protein